MGSGRSGRVTAGVFGWIHTSGVGEIADVGPGRFTGLKYVEILEEVLLPSVRAMVYPDPEPFYFLHDNSPIHTCGVVQTWFSHHPEITVMPHPPKSPDLNPIEHVWAQMNKHIPENRHRTRASVISSALEAWEQLRTPEGRELTQALVASMPARMQDVLSAGGGYTKY